MPSAAPASSESVAASGAVAAASSEVTAAEAVGSPAASAEGACALAPEDLESEDETAEAAEGEGDDGEGETPVVSSGEVPTGPLYSADISDDELARRWKDDITSLGSMAVGFAHSGRLVNSVQFPKGPEWIVVSPEGAYATQESVDYLATAIREVRARFPLAPPLRVNGMSNKEGGYMRPHKSHQNGRDIDVGFYYPTVDPIREREREKVIDVALNWAFVRAVVTKTDIQLILVDRRVQKVLYDHALAVGEDKAWLDSLFNDGPSGIIKHARRHRDHFHLRFWTPRAQELGRRVQPLLALQPEHNVTVHRVRSGDTLGGIALKYNSTVAMIRKSNHMRGSFLRIGQRVSVPLRGPCTHCPVPPPVVLPQRMLPPEPKAPAVAAAGAIDAAATATRACPKPASDAQTVQAVSAKPAEDAVTGQPASGAEAVQAASAKPAEDAVTGQPASGAQAVQASSAKTVSGASTAEAAAPATSAKPAPSESVVQSVAGTAAPAAATIQAASTKAAPSATTVEAVSVTPTSPAPVPPVSAKESAGGSSAGITHAR
ncbi:penicillin-insensitive murein endopeptidase [Myxococcus sp. K15C18031901]|uniref:LysM peptidoglycan-binding domain-containing protein n=1 Tax=Myxococcus dinghuensis TaxID=2906761 RepID=UPI0020A6F2DE|nr:penicillin-insensitive murein endopeptidase [Myxococcus dinghuensis]MCP3097466.1 penicillin-insensitive murein endopeptidase [Myxococcus dinghuensis]